TETSKHLLFLSNVSRGYLEILGRASGERSVLQQGGPSLVARRAASSTFPGSRGESHVRVRGRDRCFSAASFSILQGRITNRSRENARRVPLVRRRRGFLARPLAATKLEVLCGLRSSKTSTLSSRRCSVLTELGDIE